jgi:hypothetical protein
MRAWLAASLVAVSVAIAFLFGGTASAKFVGLTCSYVEAGPPGPAGNVLQIDGSQAEEDALSLRRTGDAIKVLDTSREVHSLNLTNGGEPLQCEGGTPTVTNIDSIRYRAGVSVGPTLQIDERGGPFAPGASDEGDGSSEIEISVDRLSALFVAGTPHADDIAFGWARRRSGFNLDAAEAKPDVDLRIPRKFELATLFGEAGADTLSANSRAGLASPATTVGQEVFINGQSGDDVLIGGRNDSLLAGGRGSDLLAGGPGDDGISLGAGRDRAYGGSGSDFFYARDGQRDRIDCGPGLDPPQPIRSPRCSEALRRTPSLATGAI